MTTLAILRDFISTMPGEEAVISKASLVAIERELTTASVAAVQVHIDSSVNSVIDGLLTPNAVRGFA
ncbi:hypothetical protein [Sphingomonas echinoides]|uniref:Uncharacterized protein n=1 Tax=Sphingomonas echinoides TaxID=59803 RepID=A0ABU4PNF3_9SPHN|nr:hypothetical protein [Sphingomonas echinoides]MDX5984682.1 hypothetical protein [Sphingomonas echinoides]